MNRLTRSLSLPLLLALSACGTTVINPVTGEAERSVMDEPTEIAEGAKAHLLAEMGSAALLRFSDGKAYRRKLISRKETIIRQPAVQYIDFRLVNASEGQ